MAYTHTFTPAHQWQTSAISNPTYRYTPPAATFTFGTPNALNQMANFNGAAMHWDANGNVQSTTAGYYIYDAENRLMSTAAGGSFAYDTLGRRTVTTFSGTVTNFVHDGDTEIAEYDGSGNLLRRFVPGAAIDEYIAMVTGAGTKTFFHADKMGSVIAMSDTNGNIAEGPYLYDAYGRCFNAGGTNCSTGEPFRFTGQRLDLATNLYYYRARYYHPLLGIFLQTDPIGYKDNLNAYAYVGDDPTDLTDPMGLSHCQTGSHLSGDAQGCESSNGGDEAGHQRNRTTNKTIAQQHPREYKKMTDTYKKNFGKDFNPNDSSAHVSQTEDDTCAKSASCTRNSAFNALTHCPGSSGCSKDAAKTGNMVFAFPVGYVHVEVDPGNHWIVNITESQWTHVLYPGVVLRESIENGQNIGILSISLGTGNFATLNDMFTPFIWSVANKHIQDVYFSQ